MEKFTNDYQNKILKMYRENFTKNEVSKTGCSCLDAMIALLECIPELKLNRIFFYILMHLY